MMPPKGRKHCRSLTPDILNNLPENVIDVILMLLPCKDAVRTSVLSKKWRHRWCRLTELTLDESLWETKKDKLYPTIKFRKIIYQILTLHEGPITKFTLDVVHLESCPEIDNFICFLLRNNIQHLVLHLPFRKIYKLPSSLSTCAQLRHLNLHYCSIYHPLAFQRFDKLISLELCEVTISSELLKSLIAHCPFLEQLVLHISDKLDTIEINAPMLRLFDYTGDINCICLKNVPRLVKVTLLGKYMQAEVLDFAKVFESCSALKHLSFNFFNSGVRYEYDSDTDDESTEELKCLSDMTFNRLEEVRVEYFTGRTSEMQFIKLLLAKSPVLERMLINLRFVDGEPLETKFETFVEVFKFLCASPKVEIIFKISADQILT